MAYVLLEPGADVAAVRADLEAAVGDAACRCRGATRPARRGRRRPRRRPAHLLAARASSRSASAPSSSPTQPRCRWRRGVASWRCSARSAAARRTVMRWAVAEMAVLGAVGGALGQHRRCARGRPDRRPASRRSPRSSSERPSRTHVPASARRHGPRARHAAGRRRRALAGRPRHAPRRGRRALGPLEAADHRPGRRDSAPRCSSGRRCWLWVLSAAGRRRATVASSPGRPRIVTPAFLAVDRQHPVRHRAPPPASPGRAWPRSLQASRRRR